MNRRSAIRYFVILSSGIALLPSCKTDPKKVSAYDHLPLDEDDQAFLADVSETIIPKTDTPGAKEAGAHLFALAMLNDCYSQADREKFLDGMKEYKEAGKKKYNKALAECTAPEREAFFTEVNNQSNSKAAFFTNVMKRLTMEGYTGSQYYLSNVEVYQLVPGKYKNSVPV